MSSAFTRENDDTESIEDIGEYRASSANLQLVLDLEKDTRFVPSVIKGERVLGERQAELANARQKLELAAIALSLLSLSPC